MLLMRAVVLAAGTGGILAPRKWYAAIRLPVLERAIRAIRRRRQPGRARLVVSSGHAIGLPGHGPAGVGRDDRQAMAGHAQQHRGTLGRGGRGEPVNVL